MSLLSTQENHPPGESSQSFNRANQGSDKRWWTGEYVAVVWGGDGRDN